MPNLYALTDALYLPQGQFIANQGFPISTITSAGALDPSTPQTYFITNAAATALTLAAPTAGTMDGYSISIISTTGYAHTVTATGLLKTGTASVNAATFAAFAGAHLDLIAYQGLWYANNVAGITFS